MRSVEIDGRRIGPDASPYIIAELSANHNGDLDRALAIMRQAKAAGADAVKLQTYTSDTMTIDCEREEFVIRGGLWDKAKLYDLYKEAHTPWDWHPVLFEEAKRLGITIFSSPFDATAVDLLESLGAPAYKIASFEIVDLPLIERCARTGKPMIISRGMASLTEIDEAVRTARNAGCEDIVLLHCVSGYPTSIDETDLATIGVMADIYGVPVGFSDHTLGVAVPIAACALGAKVIEKHVTVEDGDGGPDGAFSLSGSGLKTMVDGCNDAWRAIGRARLEPTPSEMANRKLRRSVYAVAPIRKGDRLTADTIRCIRPGLGLSPKYYDLLLNSEAAVDIDRGTPIAWSHVLNGKEANRVQDED